MRADKISFKNFRNLNTELEFSEGVNLLLGKNGEGKTNIAEGIWLNSAGKSFKNATDKEMIRFGSETGEIILNFTAADRQNELRTVLHYDGGREIYLNGVRLRRTADMIGYFFAVMFTPLTLSMIEDGPSERRRFADIAISQLKPAYLRSLMTYNAALSERNACLKLVRDKKATDYQLLAWECMMAPDGARVIGERKMYLKRLSEIAAEEYEKITGGKEKLTCHYQSSGGQLEAEIAKASEALKAWNRREPYGSVDRMELFPIENGLLQKIYNNRKKDIKEGSTSLGPHRDDFEIFIDGRLARDFASQGQKRSAVLALKAAECRIIKEEIGEDPVVILDDVLSELDSARRKYVLSNLSAGQTVITSCEAAKLIRVEKGRVFSVKEGKATEKEG
ncbi:MAG: DNA replication/repair protein RecF [Clostridia bacterium]|nr:DNA replication/repair protein RecF [Clostridia bacterium]